MNSNAIAHPHPFFHTLQQHLPAAVARLQAMDTEAMARRCGFLVRCARKIPPSSSKDFWLWRLNPICLWSARPASSAWPLAPPTLNRP